MDFERHTHLTDEQLLSHAGLMRDRIDNGRVHEERTAADTLLARAALGVRLRSWHHFVVGLQERKENPLPDDFRKATTLILNDRILYFPFEREMGPLINKHPELLNVYAKVRGRSRVLVASMFAHERAIREGNVEFMPLERICHEYIQPARKDLHGTDLLAFPGLMEMTANFLSYFATFYDQHRKLTERTFTAAELEVALTAYRMNAARNAHFTRHVDIPDNIAQLGTPNGIRLVYGEDGMLKGITFASAKKNPDAVAAAVAADDIVAKYYEHRKISPIASGCPAIKARSPELTDASVLEFIATGFDKATREALLAPREIQFLPERSRPLRALLRALKPRTA